MEILTALRDSFEVQLSWLLALFLLFGVLARVTVCNRQSFWRKDAPTDLAYYFLMPVFNRFARVIFMGAGVFFLFGDASGETVREYLQYGYGPLSGLPLWLQAAIIFLLSDVLLYFLHRWFHTAPMWKFHAIHHSSPQIDWLSTYRFHPVNSWLSFTLVDSLMLLAGFSPAALSAMVGVNMVYSAMVHANLNWTFGPLRYIFASPVFHRWHHTAQEEGMNKNFAPTFPLLDLAFGTFYMPEGRLPERYGIPGGGIPDSFLGQMLWPFRKR